MLSEFTDIVEGNSTRTDLLNIYGANKPIRWSLY